MRACLARSKRVTSKRALRPIENAQDLASMGLSLDFDLEDPEGNAHSLLEYRGSVLVLFYESREHVQDNFPLKRSFLHPRRPPFNQVRVVGVANVKSLNFAPARTFTQKAVRAIQSKFDLELLLDWEGQLLGAPFFFDPSASNVIVIGREGEVRFRHRGVMSAQDKERFVNAISERVDHAA